MGWLAIAALMQLPAGAGADRAPACERLEASAPSTEGSFPTGLCQPPTVAGSGSREINAAPQLAFLIDLIETIGDRVSLSDRVSVGALTGCRLIELGAQETARWALSTTLNSVVATMDTEGRSGGAAAGLLDLAQIQIHAGFDDDAARTLSAFDWAVEEIAPSAEADAVLALRDIRVGEIVHPAATGMDGPLRTGK
jgi:hypothetical protein